MLTIKFKNEDWKKAYNLQLMLYNKKQEAEKRIL